MNITQKPQQTEMLHKAAAGILHKIYSNRKHCINPHIKTKAKNPKHCPGGTIPPVSVPFEFFSLVFEK